MSENQDNIAPPITEADEEINAEGDETNQESVKPDVNDAEEKFVKEGVELSQEITETTEEVTEEAEIPAEEADTEKLEKVTENLDEIAEKTEEADETEKTAEEVDETQKSAEEVDETGKSAKEVDKTEKSAEEIEKIVEEAGTENLDEVTEKADETEKSAEEADETAKSAEEADETKKSAEDGEEKQIEDTNADADAVVSPRKISTFDREAAEGDGDGSVQEEDKPSIPVDFFYNELDFLCKPRISADSGLPENLLNVKYSFGYDCTKRDNLHILDKQNVCVVAGNMVKIVNLQTKEQRYLRSASGGAIGAVAVHSSRKYLAVAEKGEAPNVMVYEYPSLKLYRILRGGTEKAYAYCKFSPDGQYLATVGSDPDFMLTIWHWMEEKTVLRSKAFSQDVHRISWSQELEGYLTSAGTGHIRFWKMALTFTGLKLQGALGKFGKTELSDIEGFVELPDGKVLSGCEWGNMLLWDGGLIKVEISRKGKKNAHNGAIQQIVMDAGELMTVGIDGCIQTWDFEVIDTAEPGDESGQVEMEPMNRYSVGDDVKLIHILKTLEPDTTEWLAQDASGGIWKLDLSFSHTAHEPEKLLSCHAGKITSSDVSFLSYLVATIGEDGSVRVSDFAAKKLLVESKFNVGGTQIFWAPEIIDPKGRTIFAGFEDGVLRVFNFFENPDSDRKTKQAAELVLLQAMKPHSGPITCITIDSFDGNLLITAGVDTHDEHHENGSIFFFSVSISKYTPIGFVRVDGRPVQIKWIPGESTIPGENGPDFVRVYLADGRVCDIQCPDPTQVDVSKTFELKQFTPVNRFKFSSVKSKLRRQEELEIIHKKEETEAKKKTEERKRNLERGLESEEDQQKQVEEEEKERAKRRAEEAQWEPFIPTEPSPILLGLGSRDSKKFWLSMGEYDAGYLYECSYPEGEANSDYETAIRPPIRSVAVSDSLDVPIACIYFSKTGKRVFMGLQNGAIRVQFLEIPFDISSMNYHYTIPVHDNEYGCITSVKPSFDNKFLISVGADGNFFVFELMSEDLQEQMIELAKASVPSARKGLPRADDIDDPKAYSIEEDKQKSEHDRKLKRAEEKKAGIRKKINDLRTEFKKLKEMNVTLPDRIQLRPREFEMVPQLKEKLFEQRKEKLDLVEKEMAWDAEKCQVALNKLKKRFKDDLECELINVKAIQTTHQVTSIRATKLSEDFFLVKAEMERKRMLSNTKDLTRDTTLLSTREDTGDTVVEEKEEESPLLKTNLKGARGERIIRQLRKVEEKKKKRAQRRSEWDDLNIARPSDDYEDPVDVKGIQEARDNMGDFKLKSSNDYVVPPHLRMSSDKARQKLIEIDEQIYQRKTNFNTRLIKLRDYKLSLVKDIENWREQLKKVQSKLKIEERKSLPMVPEIDPSEIPEKKFQYTREMLIQFKTEQDAKKTAYVTGEDEGFGGFKKPATLQVADTKLGGRHTPASAHESSAEATSSASVSKSKFQLEREVIAHTRALYEQERILKQVHTVIQAFDADLRVLRHEKFDLDCSLKRGELRQLTLFEEFQLLHEFEKSEGSLANRVEQKEQEKIDIQNKVVDCSGKLELKKKDIERVQDKEKVLYDTFKESLGENNKFLEYLTKVFRKRIKRKKKEKEGEDSDEETESESEDESDLESEEEDSEGEGQRFDLDICPPGCDQNLYDNTCALREKRLDIEEELTEEKKLMDILKKEMETLQKKTRAVEVALNQAEKELEAFQLEKQHKLNQLETIVTLRLHQMLYHENGHLPADLSPCLIFEKSSLMQLKKRITELGEEKLHQLKEQREAKKRNIQLNKDRRLYQAHIDDMQVKCENMMVEKFGKVEDMERLEQIVINPKIEELTVKMLTQQEEMLNELEEWENKIRDAKDGLIQQTRDNTKRLTQMLLLYNERMGLEKQIDSRQKNLGSEYQGARASDIEEIERLMQLVQIQAQELNALKEEIAMLSRKGGHILPPVQPPLPPPGGF